MSPIFRCRIACILLVSAISLESFAEDFEPLSFALPQLIAGGGSHAARATGIMALFENPAGFVNETQELSVSALSFNISGPVFSMADLAVTALNSTAAEPLTQILAAIPSLLDASGRLYASVDLTGPIAFSYVGKGLGFGLYNRSYFNLNVSSPFVASLSVREELILMGGYGYRFTLPAKQYLDLGIMPKGFLRTELISTTTLLQLIPLISNIATVGSTLPVTITAGAGFDLGVRWTYDDMLGLGLVCRDAYSPATARTYSSLTGYIGDAQTSLVSMVPGLLPPDLSIGTFFKPSLELFSRLGTTVIFMIDYHDIFNLFKPIPRNPILNLGTGVEVQIMEILKIQAAVKDALPVVGITVDLSFMNVSFAMYGRELGIDPGQRPVYNLLLAFDFVY